MQINHCQFCGHPLQLVQVHGHYQCRVCGTNALPCCDGDNCHTNELLKDRGAEDLTEKAYSQPLLTTSPSINT